MSTSLQSVLKEVIVFPYDTETMEALSNACQTYSDDISLDDFEACLLYLCQGKNHEGLVSSIEQEMGKTFPDRVYRGLAGFIVSLVMNNEELTEHKKVLFSLLVRNVMVFSFSSTDELIKKCISPQYYAPYDEYWTEMSTIGVLPKSKLYPKVFTSDVFDQLGCTVDEVYPTIQILAKQNERSEYYKAVSQIIQEENEDDFQYAVRVVNEVQAYDWEYVDTNPVETLKKTGLKSINRMPLGQIRNHVDIEDMVTEDFSPSSLLLRCIYKGIDNEVVDYTMNPLDFAIALYYEWMFESLKESNNE